MINNSLYEVACNQTPYFNFNSIVILIYYKDDGD